MSASRSSYPSFTATIWTPIGGYTGVQICGTMVCHGKGINSPLGLTMAINMADKRLEMRKNGFTPILA